MTSVNDSMNLDKHIKDIKDIEFGGPAAYRIVVQGVLGEEWSDRLASMAINTSVDCGGGKPHTTLLGPIRDQAELNGVLDTIYNLHLPILRVEKVEDGD